MCDMAAEITHRQLRNESGEILRRAAAGETMVVTNNGQPTAVIGPPPVDVLADLEARGQLRRALASPEDLGSIERGRSDRPAAAVLEDCRGRW